MGPAFSKYPVGIFTTDEDLVVRSWDEWLERVTGIPAGKACGSGLGELFPELESRGLLSRFRRVIEDGTIEVLAPAFHHYLIPSAPQAPSKYFPRMQQRVTIAPLSEDDRRIGTVVTIEDVTARRDREQELQEQLKSSDEAARLVAARSLAAEEEIEPVQPLIGALADESWRVRGAAVEGLARRGGPDAVKGLLKALRHEHRNPSVLNSALQVLSMIELDTLTPLIEFLRDPDVELRIYAALALGEMQDRRAVPALVGALDDPDQNVRYHAIEAIGKLRAGEAVDVLCSIAESNDFFLSFPALDALVRIGNPAVIPRIAPLLGNDLLREPVAEALGRLGDEAAVAPLVSILNLPGAPAEIIARALAELHGRYEKHFGEGAHIADLVRRSLDTIGIGNLVGALDKVDERNLKPLALILGWLDGPLVEEALVKLLGRQPVRREIIESLVRYGSRVTESLTEQLSSDDVEIRNAAVVALGRIGDARAVPALIETLQRDEEMVVPVASALAKIGDRQAFHSLFDLLGHPAPAIRQAAISALNSIGHPEMPGLIAGLLEDPDPLLRESAIKIAGYFGYPECMDLLFGCCTDPNEAIRSVAVESIAFLEDERVAPALMAAIRDASPKVRAAAARGLSHTDGERPLCSLVSALSDTDPWVRYFAVHSVAKQGKRITERGTPPEDAEAEVLSTILESLLSISRTDRALQVRIAAMEALGEIGRSEAIDVLSEEANDSERDVARTAIYALGHIGNPDALAPILESLRSSDPERRLAAVRALGMREETDAVRALEWAAADRDRRVAQAAMDELVGLRKPLAVASIISLTAEEDHCEAAVDALSMLGEEEVDWIAQGLSHRDPQVRICVVRALARLKLHHATERLITALEDSDSSVRLAAINALRQLGSRQAEKRLAGLAQFDPDSSVREAAKALLRIS